MSDVTLLLPFALPPPELAADLLRALELPALALLLGRADRVPLPGAPDPARGGKTDAAAASDTDAGDAGFERALPHESWLARSFGIDGGASGSPAAAVPLMNACKVDASEGFWFILNPVHLHVARDHLVLTDQRGLGLSETASMDLFTAALPSFEEAGLVLRYGRADCWFVRADGWRDLATATPDATCGHNIDIWMPQGPSARAWRKLQNIVQMDWHEHPANAVRAADRLPAVNSLWLWGGADAARQPAVQADLAIAGVDGWHAAFGALAGNTLATADMPAVLADGAPRTLLLRMELSGPALAGDWSAWLDGMRQLESDCFAPLVEGLRAGRLDRLQLILTHATALQAWSARRSNLRRFWRAASLAGLRTQPPQERAA